MGKTTPATGGRHLSYIADPRHSFLFDTALIALTIAVMALIKSDWLFNFPWIDPWMYVGYFQNLDLPKVLAGNKKIARLPWILYGYGIHRLFGPVVGAYVIHLSTLIAGALGIYALVRRLIGRYAALLLGLFYAVNVIGHNAVGGWDYHDAATIPCLCLCYFCLLWMLKTPTASGIHTRFGPSVVFGAALALAIHVNTIAVVLLPAIVLRIVLRAPSGRRWAVLPRLLRGSLLGCILLTAILSIVSSALGRGTWFFLTLVKRSSELLKNPTLENMWMIPWSELWWLKLPHFALILLAGIFSCAQLIRERKKLVERRWFELNEPALIAIEFLATFTVLLGLQVAGHPLLHLAYMCYPLYFYVFLALSAALDETRSGHASDLSLLAAIVAAVFFIVCLMSGVEVPQWFQSVPALTNLQLLALWLLAFAAAKWIGSRKTLTSFVRQNAAFLILTSAMSISNLYSKDIINQAGPLSHANAYDVWNPCKQREALYRFVIEGGKRIRAAYSMSLTPQVWYDPDQSTGPVNCAIPIQIIGVPLVAEGMSPIMPWNQMKGWDSVPEAELKKLNPMTDLVIAVSASSGATEGLLQRLRRFSPHWTILKKEPLDVLGYRLSFDSIGVDFSRNATAVNSSARGEGGTQVQTLGDSHYRFRTPATPWAYGASLFVKGTEGRLPAGILEIRIRVTNGIVGVGILSLKNDFLDRRPVYASPEPVDIRFAIDRGQATQVMLQTWEAGTASNVEILSVGYLDEAR